MNDKNRTENKSRTELRQERRAKALRANLLKRKAQSQKTNNQKHNDDDAS